jgi:hypothetical protein
VRAQQPASAIGGEGGPFLVGWFASFVERAVTIAPRRDEVAIHEEARAATRVRSPNRLCFGRPKKGLVHFQRFSGDNGGVWALP